MAVFDDPDAAAIAVEFGQVVFAAGLVGVGEGIFGGGLEVHGDTHARALAGRAFGLDVPVHAVCPLFGDGQAEPEAFVAFGGLEALEGLEDVVELAGRHAGAGVFNHENDR